VTNDDDTPAATRPRLGAGSFLHRFGSALNHHVHLDACVTDGVFMPTADAPPAFLPVRPITQADLAMLTERVRRRIVRSLQAAGVPRCPSGRRHARLEEPRIFGGRFSSASRSFVPNCVSIVSLSNISCGMAPGLPSRWSGSP